MIELLIGAGTTDAAEQGKRLQTPLACNCSLASISPFSRIPPARRTKRLHANGVFAFISRTPHDSKRPQRAGAEEKRVNVCPGVIDWGPSACSQAGRGSSVTG